MHDITTTIEEVVVYHRGARVVRRGRLQVQNGALPTSARIAGLPLCLHDDSVALSLAAEGGPSPVALDVRVALDVPPPDPALKPAEPKALRDAETAVARAQAKVNHLERELERTKGLEVRNRAKGADGAAPGQSPTAARLSLAEFRESRSRELYEQLSAARNAHEQTTRARNELRAQDRIASSARQAKPHELRKSVQVALEADGDAPASVEVTLEYFVPGARWAPAYALYLDRAMAHAEIAMRAVVAQDTGEDWTAAPLRLSTADAQRYTDLPELASIRIGRRQQREAKPGWRPPPSDTAELYRDWDRAFGRGDKKPPAPVATASRLEEDELAMVGGAGHELEGALDEPVHEELFDADELIAGAAPEPATMELEAPPPMMAAAAMPPPRAKSSKRKRKATAAPAGRAARAAPAASPRDEPALPDELSPEDALMDYAALRMPGPDEPRRGVLTVTTRQAIYVELLLEQRISLGLDQARSTLSKATRKAEAVDSLALPRGCRYAWSEDYDYSYRTNAGVDVPSDGAFHSVPLGRAPAKAAPRHVVVPRESADVYRTVSLDNPFQAPLLAGPIDVYLGDSFLLSSDVEFTPPRSPLHLGLGVEQTIKVARNTRYREEAAGLIRGTLELHHEVLVEARNNLDSAVMLEVRERIPSVRDDEDDIKIVVGKVTPAWETYEQRPLSANDPELQGGHRWVVTLEPGSVKEMKASYEVRISAKHELVGGNRRES